MGSFLSFLFWLNRGVALYIVGIILNIRVITVVVVLMGYRCSHLDGEGYDFWILGSIRRPVFVLI